MNHIAISVKQRKAYKPQIDIEFVGGRRSGSRKSVVELSRGVHTVRVNKSTPGDRNCAG